MICDLDNIQNIIKDESLNLCVVSYGGSCSNTLVDILEENGYICKTDIWRQILCHCPKYIDVDIPIIYIYDNPIKSFLSMKNRKLGYWDVNQQKLSNNKNIELSDENLLKLMIQQFNRWTDEKKDNVLIIKSSDLFEKNILNTLEIFLKNKLKNFPIKYKIPSSKIDTIDDKNLIELFEKYKVEIDKINNFADKVSLTA
jgi:hypothetical protein